MDWKLELVVIPVTDVDRSKQFYEEKLGFALEADNQLGPMRVVQLTPPGSACSICIGPAVVEEPPAEPLRLQLVVSDIEAAHAELVERGLDVSEISHFDEGVKKPGAGGDYNSFVFLNDPDGHGWAIQQGPARAG